VAKVPQHKSDAAADSPAGPLRVATLAAGETADGVVIVRKKVRREKPDGESFLLFQLGDNSGQINAILWRGADIVDRALSPGDLAHVQGEVQLYQNTRQIRIQRIQRADPTTFDVTQFLPSSPRDLQKQFAHLLEIMDSVQQPHLRQLYSDILRDPAVGDRFRQAPAGKGWHHAYIGGLLEHCLSMIELAEVLVRQHAALDRDLLLGGIVLHDIGKIEELLFRSYIDYTTAGKLVGHLVQGCLLVGRYMDRIDDFPEELRNRVLHMLVSHHGALERGSPKPPMTLEATILHLIDHLDSQAHAIARVVGETRSEDGWSEHVRLINRSIYRGPNATPEGS
jgi:3'-5' exoribonuclease